MSPSAIYFGNVIQGQVKRISCTVINSGSGSLTISRAHSSNALFTVTTPHLPDVLRAGGKAVFTVTFAPKALRHTDAGITFNSNGSDSSFTLPIHGTGVEAGTLRAAPASVSFGSVQVGSSSASFVSVKNVGFSNVKISSDALSNARFGLSGLTLPLTLTSQESITFKVSFKPAAGGVQSGGLAIHSSATNPALTVALSGNGIASGRLTASPTTVYFGTTSVGTQSNRSATLQASGGTVVISSSSTGSAEFALTGVTLPLQIVSGKSVTVGLRFKPQSSGLATASLRLQSNAANSLLTLALQGHGAAADASHSVALSWRASSSSVAGYNVYRGTKSGGPYSKINSSLDAATSYSDTSVTAGDSYYYVVTAMGTDGVESTHSSQVGATIPGN